MNDIRSLADILRRQGRFGDTELAHINPEEAEILEEMGGSGTINPVTGLREYFWPYIATAIGGAIGSNILSSGRSKRKDQDDEDSFLSKLGSKSSDFFSDPVNLLSVGSVAASALSRPKKERRLTPEEEGENELRRILASRLPPEELAARRKRYDKASRMTQDEMRDHFNYLSDLERREWEARNNLGFGERLQIDPVYRKQNDEDEFERTGRWFEYYNDPEFKSKRVYMAKGGEVPPKAKGFTGVEISVEPLSKNIFSLSDVLKQVFNPNHGGEDEDFASGFIDGDDGGQDDTIEARLSPGEYVIDAETVAHIGDGNSKNGAKKLDELVRRIREHKRSASLDAIAPSILE